MGDKVYLICNKDDANLFHDGRLTCDWVPLERAKFYHREGDAKGALTQCRKHAERNDVDFNAEIARGEIYFAEDAKLKDWQEVEVTGRDRISWVVLSPNEHWDYKWDITKQEG